MTFTLQPQNLEHGSYHPRGYPYGGQINPYWDNEKITRFKNALDFPPFKGHLPEPPQFISNNDCPNVRIMLGFDCDRPRGEYVLTEEGSEMADRKINSIEYISKELESLGIPRTFFVCGEFLETMNSIYGAQRLITAFQVNNSLVEFADHSYSHNILKKIDSRPDKTPIPPKQVVEEFRKNTDIFQEILEINIPNRGYRAPLGHFGGLEGEYRLLDRLLKVGVTYVSSDLRDENHSLHPKLIMSDRTPRQPYRYENGLLEIPSMGWQDTVFSGTSRSPILEKIPQSYEEIIEYYKNLFQAAYEISIKSNRDYFLGLVLHPYDNSLYNQNGQFFADLHEKVIEFGGSFCTYNDVYKHYTKL
jgi:peptidoglycan/xylan/chitin deacetylase (PgdA/CDA1 family)